MSDVIPAGFRAEGLGGQAYIAKCDIKPYDFLTHKNLEAVGGAPETGHLPDWVVTALVAAQGRPA